jgi:methyl-accepting chemotaxis protein
VSAGYLNYYTSQTNTSLAVKNIRASEYNAALKVTNSLDASVFALRSFASSVSGTDILSESQRLEVYKTAANNFLSQNPSYDNIKISWELSLIDFEWSKSYGRRVYSFERGDGSTRYTIEDVDKEGDDFSGSYYKAKINGLEQITGIVSEDPENPSVKPIYKSTVLIPVMDAENNFCAMVSGDLEVENFNTMVKNSVGYVSVASFLLTNTGQFAGVASSVNENQRDDLMRYVATVFYDIKTKVDSSGFAFYALPDSLGMQMQLCGTGLENKIFDSKWFLVSAVDGSVITAQNNSQYTATILIVVLGLMFLGLFIFVLTSDIANFLGKSGDMLRQFSLGNFHTDFKIEGGKIRELELISDSVNDLKAGLDKAVAFAEEIGRGNLDAPFKPLSDNDELGSSLLSMRDSLKKAQVETDERQELDRKQNWITEGTAKFGDILREYNNDMFDFSFNIISNLVKYVGANQGGLFVINDDNKDDVYFELTAGYAYNIRKILKKKVEPGVGLIGRCILENDSIYISNLPEDYINITSGLGEKSPQYLLIVPFKFNNKIYAVVEIASFNEIEPYKQQFVEEVGNSIASTIATVKINIQTNKLLQELKVQSEELASQEEEMRQNMEEMKATQEDMSKKVDEYTQTNDVLNQMIMLAEYTPEGKLSDINLKAAEFFGKPRNEIIGLSQPLYETVMSSENTQTDEFWLQIRLGKGRKVTKTVKINGNTYALTETYSPVQNYYGKIYKIICLFSLSEEGVIFSNGGEGHDGGEFF